MTMLIMTLCSVGNLTRRKRTAVATVLDACPALRPGRVGDDPPRVPVVDTIAPHIAVPELPIWLTGAERRHEERATWFFDFNPEWVADEGPGGIKGIARSQSEITLVLGPNRVRDAGGLDRIVELFRELGDAFGAAFGCIFPEQYYGKLDAWYPDGWARPDPQVGLGTAYWAQYFGPAFVYRYPGLRELPRAASTSRGSVIYRATDTPEQTLHPGGGPLEGAWREPLIAVLGEGPFRFDSKSKASLPSSADHASYDPESEPAPSDLVDRLARTARERIAQRSDEYSRAHERRLRLERRREQPTITDFSHEWSTNVDSDQVLSLWKDLRSRLALGITGPYAGALAREIANAPRGDEGEVHLDSEYGAFLLAWWVEDEESLVLAARGPSEVIRKVEAALE